MSTTVSKQLPATHHQELLLLSSSALVLTPQPSCSNSTVSLFFVMLAILHHLAICQRRPIDTARILMYFNKPHPPPPSVKLCLCLLLGPYIKLSKRQSHVTHVVTKSAVHGLVQQQSEA